MEDPSMGGGGGGGGGGAGGGGAAVVTLCGLECTPTFSPGMKPSDLFSVSDVVAETGFNPGGFTGVQVFEMSPKTFLFDFLLVDFLLDEKVTRLLAVFGVLTGV